MLKKIRNLIIFLIIKFFYLVFSKTPYWFNLLPAKIIGFLFYSFDFKYKYIAYRNIKRVFQHFKPEQIIKIVKRCYLNLSQNFMEFFLLKRVKNFYKKILIFSNEDKQKLRNLYNKNKGVIIFSAHFSNWELLGCGIAIEKFPLAVVVRDFYIPQVNDIIYKIRMSAGEKIIGRGKQTSIKELLAAVKNKYVIGVLIDQNIKNVKNINIPFLGQNSPTPVSFVELAIKYQIPSVIGLIYKNNINKYEIKIIPIEESYYSDKIKFLKYINDVISEYIIKFPDQWIWMHNRWIN